MHITMVIGKKDPDLMSLYKKIGQKNMVKVLRYSVIAIQDTSYIYKIREICSLEGTDVKNDERIHIVTSFSSNYINFITSLKEKIKPRLFSQFLKYLVRYTIGIDNVLPGFFNDDVSFKKAETVKLEISGVNSEVKSVTPRKTTKRKTKSVTKPKITNTSKIIDTPSLSSDINNDINDFDTLSFDPDIDKKEEQSQPVVTQEFDALSILNNILG